MTDNNGDAGSAAPVLGDPNATGSQLALQAVYLKDSRTKHPMAHGWMASGIRRSTSICTRA